ncbi:MAG: transcription-repair coupling factor [Ignavibacteriales bacterium]|nr:transcription-repair coupling factor [Ignavibacteriales bacterium]
MEKHIDTLINNIQSLSELKEKIFSLSSKEKIFVSPFAGSPKSLFIKTIVEEEKQILLLFPTAQSVNEAKVELSILELEDLIVSVDELNDESLQEKLTVLNKRNNFILISTYEILKLKLPSKNTIDKNTTKVEIGGNLTYNDLIEYFNSIDYNRDKYVDDPGDYAVRGSIIDFWSYSEKQPVRLEFDGDFIESIRHFDPDSQRSLDKLFSATVAASINAEELSADIFDYLNDPLVFADEFELRNLFNKKTNITPQKYEEEIDDDLKEELYETSEVVERKEEKTRQKDAGQVERRNENFDSVEKLFETNTRWIIEDAIGHHDERINLQLNQAPAINSNFELLFTFLKDYASKNFQIIIAVENELQNQRLYELLADYKKELAELFDAGKIKIIVFGIKSGFIAKHDNLILLTDYQIFNKPYRTKLSTKLKYKKSRVKDFASIKKGDFVVHENFGIGQFVGLETIKIGSTEQESIKILYAEGGVVYVNLNYLSLVKKFSSKDNIAPRLSVLGGGEWKSTKKKAKAKIKEAARELITLYARRKSAQGFSFSADSIWQKELEASFFYEDTPDQTKVTEEVKRDMESENPMDRLVCGDVGFGKTEIAVRAAFKAINDGKQVALLVPTTILAEQHYNTFKDRLIQFPVKVEALSRFQNKSEQTAITKNLEKGEVDLVIGTHRLLSKDISFKELGLLIIDEEHRFGVMAKEKLRSLKANIDTLTLTATPIPRTLNLSLLGARDLSIIATPPPNRQSIYTKVEMFDIHKVREWILTEVKRNGQIYFVHDRVQSIDKIAAYIQKYVPEIKIGVAHGQMKPSQLEDAIHKFLSKQYHMLISTKIIESGLDIPNVNTIIINRADRFGLAELHQLRGRVGRSDRQAYAYFLVPSLDTITRKAVKRLQAIEEYTDLGEGFNLSMRDLEIRGAGNLLGTEQSGFIDTIGFDMYLKLLDEAVDELKQDEFKEVFKDLPKQQERSSPTIDTFFEIGIPHSYMPDQADRLSFYTALFSMLKIEELEEIKEEMTDRFGKIPPNVERLILSAVLRFYSSFALFERVVIQFNKITIVLPKGDKEKFYQNKFIPLLTFINKNYSKDIKFVQANETMKFEMNNKFGSAEAAMNFLIKLCKEIIEVVSKIS